VLPQSSRTPAPPSARMSSFVGRVPNP
jgi:hypothetical protein